MYVEKKMLVLPALIMMALSITGVAVAHWSDSIQLEGTIHMGSLTLAFHHDEPPIIGEFHRLDNGDLVPGEPCGKDVAETDARYENRVDDPHTGKWGYKTMIIVIDNAYPCYEPHIIFTIHNIGVIPLDVENYIVSDPTSELRPICSWVNDDFVCDLVDADNVPIINLLIRNDNLPYQIDPCYNEKLEIDLHIKQEALECHTYQLKVEIVAEQWSCPP